MRILKEISKLSIVAHQRLYSVSTSELHDTPRLVPKLEGNQLLISMACYWSTVPQPRSVYPSGDGDKYTCTFPRDTPPFKSPPKTPNVSIPFDHHTTFAVYVCRRSTAPVFANLSHSRRHPPEHAVSAQAKDCRIFTKLVYDLTFNS